MSTKLKNILSGTEEVIDNAGAVTGPKASKYKFNDIDIPIFSSNFQVKVEPQHELEIEVKSNSIEDHYYRSLANKLPVSIGGEQPSGATFTLTVTSEDGEHVTYESTMTVEEVNAMHETGTDPTIDVILGGILAEFYTIKSDFVAEWYYDEGDNIYYYTFTADCEFHAGGETGEGPFVVMAKPSGWQISFEF